MRRRLDLVYPWVMTALYVVVAIIFWDDWPYNAIFVACSLMAAGEGEVRRRWRRQREARP